MRVCVCVFMWYAFYINVIILLWLLYDIFLWLHICLHVNGLFQNIRNGHYKLVPLISGAVYIQISDMTNFLFIRN